MDYEGIIGAAKGSIKAKQLAAQLIPRFYKFFPDLQISALDAIFDLCEEEELAVCYLFPSFILLSCVIFCHKNVLFCIFYLCLCV